LPNRRLGMGPGKELSPALASGCRTFFAAAKPAAAAVPFLKKSRRCM
jgi:hypothetical protein